MSDRKYPPRGVILLAAAVCGGLTGAIYMWSIFNKPLMELYGWVPQQVSLAYSLFLLMMAISGIISGWLQRRMSARTLVLVAGIGLSTGWVLTGFANSIPTLYLTFSLVAGFFDGLIYNAAVSTAAKWFPDKRGFASGVCIGAMGLAPLPFAPIGNALIESFGAPTSFKIVGGIFLALFLVFSWFIEAPPAGWLPKGWKPEEGKAQAASVDIKSRDMFKKPVFWVLWALFAVAATSGLMMTGHASGIGQELAGLSPTQGALLVGILAAANFTGRFGFGALSDKIGRYNGLLLVTILTAVIMLFFGRADSFATFTIVLCAVGACYGGVMTIMPSLCGDLFGMVNFGQNYAFLFTGFTCASFIGPMLAANVFASTGSYAGAFPIAAVLTLASVPLILLVRKLAQR